MSLSLTCLPHRKAVGPVGASCYNANRRRLGNGADADFFPNRRSGHLTHPQLLPTSPMICLCPPCAWPSILAWWLSPAFIGQSALASDLGRASDVKSGGSMAVLMQLQIPSGWCVINRCFPLASWWGQSAVLSGREHLRRWEAFLLFCPQGFAMFSVREERNLKTPQMWLLRAGTHSHTH